MNRYEYKLAFESDIEDVPNILIKITKILETELKDKITNIMPTFTILKEE